MEIEASPVWNFCLWSYLSMHFSPVQSPCQYIWHAVTSGNLFSDRVLHYHISHI